MRGLFGALSLLAGCQGPECTVEVTELHTVLRAEVTTPRPERLRAVWSSEGREAATPLEPEAGTDHALLLVDLDPLADVDWRVLDAADDEVCAGTASTGNLPSGTPTFDVVTDLGVSAGYWLVAMSSAAFGVVEARLAVLRRDGTHAWAYVHPTLGEQIVSADLTDQGVRFNRFDGTRQVDLASVETIALDGAPLGSRRTLLGHHFYTALEGGAIAYLRADSRVVAPYGCVVGDALVEQATDGTERVIWSAWDVLTLAPSAVWADDFYPGCKDWTRGSGLSYRAADDSFLISLVGTQQLVHVGRAGGETLQVFGGAEGLPPASGSPAFEIPHGAQWTASGELLVFDGRAGGSGCHAYRIDEPAGALVLEEAWIDPAYSGRYLGSATELPDGDILCSWGSDGFFRVFERGDPTPTYELVVNGLYQFGAVSTRAGLPGLESR